MNKQELINKLVGKGVELGALHNPVEINSEHATVIYADKLKRMDAIKAFPELEDVANKIVETDIIVDLDRDSLSFIKGKHLDFVIANHVIEHLVNPIRFLKVINDNLKEGGLLLLTVPNKDYTLDVNRQLTRFRHLVIEYLLMTKHLSNKHITDYLKNKLPVENVHPRIKEFFEQNGLPLSYYDGNKIPLNPISRNKLYQYHRDRSIHVHVWNRHSFDVFLNKTIKLFKLNLQVENYLPSEISQGEMIYLLKKVN